MDGAVGVVWKGQKGESEGRKEKGGDGRWITETEWEVEVQVSRWENGRR